MTKKQTRKFNNVVDLIRDLADEDFVNELEEQLQSRAVITSLIAKRISRGISQEAVAKQLGCTQSRISKLEAGRDAEMRLDELAAYGHALGIEFEIIAHRLGSTSVDRVKAHVGCIHRELKALASLVKGDQSLAEGVSEFFGETLFNVVRKLQDAGKELPKRPTISMQLDTPNDRSPEPETEQRCEPRQRARRKKDAAPALS